MPADEDYGRRQISQQQQTQVVPPPGLVTCPAGCSAPPLHHHQPEHRYSSDKNLLDLQERFQFSGNSERASSDRLPSGERYQGVSERYPLGERPQASVSSEWLAKDAMQAAVVCQSDRYHYGERNERSCQRYPERYTPVGSLERYHTNLSYSRTNTPTEKDRYHNAAIETERYTPTERHRGSKPDVYKIHDRSSSSERKDRYQYQRYDLDRYPERFGQERPERIQYSQQVPYLEPPSPAPAGDRFIPPPPLSPEGTPSPDCFTNNAFPSPTAVVPERFIPPPPLSPSPTEPFSPKQRFQERYSSPNSERYQDRFGDRERKYYQERYQGYQDRINGDRYVPPNAHTPVDRYVPQQQEPYYQQYQGYYNNKFTGSDPYMRRDLGYHYRLPLPYQNQYHQRVRYVNPQGRLIQKCCFDGYQLSKSSPGSSSSSSVTSQGKDLKEECQSYQQCGYQHQQVQQQQQQQEKSTQCGSVGQKDCVVGFVSPRSGAAKACRHSICGSPGVEYVGGAGGRHVCATPPPRNAVAAEGIGVCVEGCCSRRNQSSQLAVAVWRGSTPVQQQQGITQQQQQETPARSSTSTPSQPIQEDVEQVRDRERLEEKEKSPRASPPQARSPPVVQRAVSMPVSASPEMGRQQPRGVTYSQSERLGVGRGRPTLNRSMSKKDMIKNYIRRETANFFGVDENNEEEQQLRWLDRRKRMASRTMGPLKDEYRISRDPSHGRADSDIGTSPISGQLIAERPDVLPGPSDFTDGRPTVNLRRKDSVAKMTMDGISYVVTALTRHPPRPRSQQHPHWSRSYPPDTSTAASTPEEQSFFDRPQVVASPTLRVGDELGTDSPDRGRDELGQYRERDRRERAGAGGWRREHEVVLRHGEQRPNIGRCRIISSMLDRVLDNSNRRQYGMGCIGKLFGRKVRKSVAQDITVLQQLDDMEDYRPMFTYWVTFVQILVLFISVICYGFGPFGINLQSRSGQVLVTSLSLQQVDYMEPANFWLGPRAADLIHLGAKFAPCMRKDDKVLQQIDKIKSKERETACCIRNDDSGCVQSTQSDCSKIISTWKKWTTGDAGPGGRISGSVCGLDPKFCDAPASVHPHEWPDDITQWPICRKTNTQISLQKKGPKDKPAEHMLCEVIGHPCCIGIHGQCKITTKEYCDFVRGTFHEEASLCSQVYCLNDVCGMIPFYFPHIPDQFYRLWTSLFLHAGVLQLAITIVIQWFLMRDLEKLTGSFRIAIIYIGSGVAGNLASAIFVPYRADVGPSGSQFGLLACLIVEVLNAWPMLKHPNQALCKLLTVTAFLFLVGLLPWVDNFGHLFGFIFGFLLSYALLPFISFGRYDRQKKVLVIWTCLVSAAILFVCLVLLFYVIPVYDCEICSYFNCIPFTRDFCASQNINFRREEPIV